MGCVGEGVTHFLEGSPARGEEAPPCRGEGNVPLTTHWRCGSKAPRTEPVIPDVGGGQSPWLMQLAPAPWLPQGGDRRLGGGQIHPV